jgi:hypothetical protein
MASVAAQNTDRAASVDHNLFDFRRDQPNLGNACAQVAVLLPQETFVGIGIRGDFHGEIGNETLHALFRSTSSGLGRTEKADVGAVSVAFEIVFLFANHPSQAAIGDKGKQYRNQVIAQPIVEGIISRHVNQLSIDQFMSLRDLAGSRSKSSIVSSVVVAAIPLF